MADTKQGREDQARDEENRQRTRAMEEARERADETEPPPYTRDDDEGTRQETDEPAESPPECHRRGCTVPAAFVVLERYQEDTGHGVVEAEAALCEEHTDEESPSNLDKVYADYVFRVQPIPGTVPGDAA